MKKIILIITLILTAYIGLSQEKHTFPDTSEVILRAFELKKSNPLYNLLGKDVFGKEVVDFTSSLGTSETESFRDIRHLQYFASGVEIVYNVKDEKIASIFLHAPNYNNWYDPYSGELPYGFNWSMTKSDVENLIGYGEERQLMSDVYYQYKHHKIEIKYFKGSENPKMKSIQIRNFEE